MSNTPETDASRGYALSSHYGRLDGSYLQMDQSGPFVHAEVARKLERERDEAMDKYATEATEHMLAVNKLCNERDEARDAILGWENKWRCAIEMAARAELERDDAQIDAKLLSERLTALELQSTAELARLEQELINMKELYESNN